tara:strand:+ start:4819 stop:5010 length:192 start_codon:yes stop_codon:yes gene_type:complete
MAGLVGLYSFLLEFVLFKAQSFPMLFGRARVVAALVASYLTEGWVMVHDLGAAGHESLFYLRM